MTSALGPATGLLFAFAGVGAIGVIVGTVVRDGRRIVRILRNEKTPVDQVSTGVPSLRTIAGRRSRKDPSFPSQARRGDLRITISRQGETRSVAAPASVLH